MLPYSPSHSPASWLQFSDTFGLAGRALYAVGFRPHWRPTLQRFVQGTRLRYVEHFRQVPDGAVVLVWGQVRQPEPGQRIILVRIEDGFLRSVGLGAEFARPLSWVFDFDHLYFDATGPSRLERLLAVRDWTPAEQERAQRLMERIVTTGISKYNLAGEGWHPPDARRRTLLVPGQVETDASIAYGAGHIRSNLELLKRVRREHPDAWVIYKPHPDVTAGARRAGQGESEAEHWCDELVSGVGIEQLLAQVDEVHTMTSLTGFEALIRRKTVVCYGMPFYAGWGLTQDREPAARRGRTLTIEALVHGVLIDYPFYVSMKHDGYITPEEAVIELLDWRGRGSSWQAEAKRMARKVISRITGSK